MAADGIAEGAEDLAEAARGLADQAQALAVQAPAATAGPAGEHGFFLTGLTVFVLACFVGYYVVWRGSPALHSPPISVTNAISSGVAGGALIAAGPAVIGASSVLGALAVLLASVNIFGGFLVTRRMLAMYRKKG
ncbi:NAD(P) transhydrogenase subunit alpha [Inquilinus sp. Marseille-Q2685]|uniref:NAD(P) transhydrogenase subunit alpha n=1 Tax=Inquilinus sp. Marseille-Q2685 TaxID=2866581 RepID=UPI001CE408E9|nr:NAD(P) transhydrogenase subunit alpha [Inquilinus sp. Marseille-Q2685]